MLGWIRADLNCQFGSIELDLDKFEFKLKYNEFCIIKFKFEFEYLVCRTHEFRRIQLKLTKMILF